MAYQLRAYSAPDKYSTRYLLPATVAHVTRTRAKLSIPLLDMSIDLTASAALKWMYADPNTPPYPDPTVLITPEILNRHPLQQRLSQSTTVTCLLLKPMRY